MKARKSGEDPKRGTSPACDPMEPKGSCVIKGYLGTQGLASEISRRKGMEKMAAASMKTRPVEDIPRFETNKKGDPIKKKK
jgi:hypothetical protein